MPSNWYARQNCSVHGLLQPMEGDLQRLFTEGLDLTVALFAFHVVWLQKVPKPKPQKNKS